MKRNWKRTTTLLLFIIIVSGLLFLTITKTNIVEKLSTSTTQLQMEIYLSQETDQFIANHPYSDTTTNPDGSSLNVDVPGNSLSGTYSVTTHIYCTNKNSIISEYPAPEDKTFTGIFCNISFTNSNDGTPITHMDEPVTVTYTYVNSEVEGLDPESLEIYHWNGFQWVLLDDNTVDTTEKTVSGTTQDFSPFALFGILGDPGDGVDETETPTPPPPPPSQSIGQGSPIPVIDNKDIALYRVGDLNGDYEINLTDFSIAAYWYKRLLSVEMLIIEGRNLNGDRIIDMSDLELMSKKFNK